MSIGQRKRWLHGIENKYDRDFYISDWFNNIYGVLDFADDHDLVDKSRWFSVVDSGILQGLQEGLAANNRGQSRVQ